MKILVVCQHFYPEQFRINDLCFEFAKKGHEVTVLTGLPNYPKGKVFSEYKWFKKRKEVLNGIKIKRTFVFGRGSSKLKISLNYLSFAVISSIKAFFMKKDFDVIYVFQLSPITMVWPARVVKKMKKIPLIIHCLDQWPVSVTAGGISEDSLAYKILYKWSKKSYESADIITISSKSFVNYFEEVLQISKSEKGLIYTPSYAESNYSNVKKTKNDVFDLVFAGNVGPAQSVETIVEAANLLKQNKNIFFHIVGDGLSREICENMVKRYGLNNIKFYGYHNVEKMNEFYDLADAFLITMVDNEVVNSTLPAKVQSYMAAGKPIIGAISGEVKEVIEDANCGLCCESLDYKELANIIEMMETDKKQQTIFSKNSLNYYKKNFDKEHIISKIEEIMYNSIDLYKQEKRNK